MHDLPHRGAGRLMRAPSYHRPPKTNPNCPAKNHQSISSHKNPPKGQKCECAEAIAAYKESESKRESKKSGRPPRLLSKPIPATTPAPSAPALEPDTDWARDAACRREDPELFFPLGEGPAALAQTAQARAVCRACPVRTQCLRRAVAIGAQGVWGGTTDDERRAMRRAGGRTVA